MEFLVEDRRALEEILPGFDARLASIPLAEMEARDSRVIELFRDAGGAGLVVPRDLEGHGALPSTAIRVQRAIGSRSPSLAVATTMHHFSTASLIELQRAEGGFEWLMLQAIAERGRLLASGFAEGVHGQGVFSLLTASVAVAGEAPGVEPEFAVALLPAGAPGLEVSDFWASRGRSGGRVENADAVQTASFLWFFFSTSSE